MGEAEKRRDMMTVEEKDCRVMKTTAGREGVGMRKSRIVSRLHGLLRAGLEGFVVQSYNRVKGRKSFLNGKSST